MNAREIIEEFQERYGTNIPVKRSVKLLNAAYLQVLGDIGYFENDESVNMKAGDFVPDKNFGDETQWELDNITHNTVFTGGDFYIWTGQGGEDIDFRAELSEPLFDARDYQLKVVVKEYVGGGAGNLTFSVGLRKEGTNQSVSAGEFIVLENQTVPRTYTIDLGEALSDNQGYDRINFFGMVPDNFNFELRFTEIDIVRKSTSESILKSDFIEMKEGVFYNGDRLAPMPRRDADDTVGTPTNYYIYQKSGKQYVGLWPAVSDGTLEYRYSAKDTVFADILDSSGDVVMANLTETPMIEDGFEDLIIFKAGVNLGRMKNPGWETDKIEYNDRRADLLSLKSKHRNDGIVTKPIDF